MISMKSRAPIIVIFLCAFSCRLLCSAPASLYFTPDKRTEQVILDLVKSAEKSICIATYSLSWDALVKELNGKKGVRIRIISDSAPPGGLLNSEVRVMSGNFLFHPKIMIIDGLISVVGSGNFTESGFRRHHNHFLVFSDRKMAGFLSRKFDSWWLGEKNDVYYDDGRISIFFSPENDCSKVICDRILSSKKSVNFAVYHFTSVEIARALVKRRMAGVTVSGMVERGSIEPYSVYGMLANYGCRVRKSNMAGYLHDKFMVVDGEFAISGSYNFTVAARKNVEVVMVIRDPSLVLEFMEEWKRIWRWKSLP